MCKKCLVAFILVLHSIDLDLSPWMRNKLLAKYSTSQQVLEPYGQIQLTSNISHSLRLRLVMHTLIRFHNLLDALTSNILGFRVGNGRDFLVKARIALLSFPCRRSPLAE
jgi:hypothetical protein